MNGALRCAALLLQQCQDLGLRLRLAEQESLPFRAAFGLEASEVASVSTPSAVIVMPRLVPRLTIARTIAASRRSRRGRARRSGRS